MRFNFFEGLGQMMTVYVVIVFWSLLQFTIIICFFLIMSKWVCIGPWAELKSNSILARIVWVISHCSAWNGLFSIENTFLSIFSSENRHRNWTTIYTYIHLYVLKNIQNIQNSIKMIYFSEWSAMISFKIIGISEENAIKNFM